MQGSFSVAFYFCMDKSLDHLWCSDNAFSHLHTAAMLLQTQCDRMVLNCPFEEKCKKSNFYSVPNLNSLFFRRQFWKFVPKSISCKISLIFILWISVIDFLHATMVPCISASAAGTFELFLRALEFGNVAIAILRRVS